MIMIVCLFSALVSQEIESGIINVQYEQKSVKTAMFLSALLPGAGQFYTDSKSITAYIFPLIEIGLWYGYFSYSKQGNDKEEEYMDFADQYYNREHQNQVQLDLQQSIPNPFYDDHFHLDPTNSQHYYEDIGKYEHYIFGWNDWYDIYAVDDDGVFGPAWITQNFGDFPKWVGNDPLNEEAADYQENQQLYDQNQGIYSTLRADYINMRQEAEDFFSTANTISFGIVANHILASLDALRVTRRHNLEYISNNNIKIKLAPVFVNNELAPALLVSKGF